MQVRDILQAKGKLVVTICPDDTIVDIARLLIEENVGSAVALDEGGRVAGLISERDIVRGLARFGWGALAMSASELMCRDMVFCEPGDQVSELIAMMTSNRVRHVPVLDDEELVGVVSIGDLLKSHIEQTENEATVLREYIAAR